MAGRIRDEDIALVRERARIDEVISQYVTLRPVGGGNLKGLCPFHDEKSPSFNVTPSRGFYHCLAGETEVITWDGPRPIRDLAGGVHRVLVPGRRWVDAPFKSFGVQQLHKIVVTRNRQTKELYATDGHRWFLRSGKQGNKRPEVVTTGLKAGDRLSYVYPGSRIRRTTPSPFGIAHGFTFGDGTLNGSGSMALLARPKDADMLKWFPNSHVTSRDDGHLLVHHLPRFFKAFPDLDESTPYLLGWLAGYFAADGCVAADGTVILNSAKREHLEFVRTLCTRLGIATFGITKQLRRGLPEREPSELYCVHLVNEDLSESFFLLDEHRRSFTTSRKSCVSRSWVVQSVEPTDRVEEVFCAVVDDGHAFALADNILTGNCFGCQEGGDAFTFLQKMDGIGFTESVERLAGRYGIALRYEDGAGAGPRRDPQRRARLVEANRTAAAFYLAQLADAPDARVARQFLDERGFDRGVAERFGLGFAPRGGEALLTHLRQKGFAEDELVSAGLIAKGQRGGYDRFRGRLLWPIRDLAGDVVGFGARRLFDDDRIEAKYLNTPETSLYKKSQVLYGVDLARRPIAQAMQAVVVEGYTDVMACHEAGVQTAVATCGTAFGPDHGRVLRRLLADHDEFRGEVIFTFDGDEAGQAAAMRAFSGDEQFVAQTYVAIEPDGLDPCSLREAKGDAAVRELIARRLPLYRFVLRNVVGRFDLDRADQRVNAMREAARLVASVRDKSKVDAFARELAGMVGMDLDEVRTEVRRAAAAHSGGGMPTTGREQAPTLEGPAVPDVRESRYADEREALKALIQYPQLVGDGATEVDIDDFTHPWLRATWEAIAAESVPVQADAGWPSRVRERVADEAARSLVSALAVEPLRSAGEPTSRLVGALLARLQELTVSRRVQAVKSRLQRTNPVEQQADYNRMAGELFALEQQRRSLRDRGIGGIDP
ncbi:MAG TPA: DNA primase [Nocardioidaceae bacterium]|nr:DNA primase [Nocardioidaceae bacterium]